MEFGEKLKTVREEKGMTQQTLADNLFVTRQAVSRWESGTRYPDLMTAKKLADFLETSLDELISGDNWKDYAEKQPIIENAKTGHMQTAVYAISLILWLIITLTKMPVFAQTNILSNLQASASVAGNTLFHLLIVALLAYGTLKSIQQSVNPKLAGFLLCCYYGSKICGHLIMLFFISTAHIEILCLNILAEIFCITLICHFFFSGTRKNPWGVYLVLGANALITTYSNILSMLGMMSQSPKGTYNELFSWYRFIIMTLPILLLMGLGMVQTRIVSQKRRLEQKI